MNLQQRMAAKRRERERAIWRKARKLEIQWGGPSIPSEVIELQQWMSNRLSEIADRFCVKWEAR